MVVASMSHHSYDHSNTTRTTATLTCEHFDFHDDDAPVVAYSLVDNLTPEVSVAQTHVPNDAVPVLNIKGEIINFVLLETVLNSGLPDLPSPFDDFEMSSQESTSERVGDQVVDVPSPQNLEGRFEECTQELIIEQTGDQIVASASNYARNHRGPCSSTFVRYVAPAPTAAFDDPAPVIEHVALAPAVGHATPAPVIEYVTPSPVIENMTPAPPVTFATPSEQCSPAYTMESVTTSCQL